MEEEDKGWKKRMMGGRAAVSAACGHTVLETRKKSSYLTAAKQDFLVDTK